MCPGKAREGSRACFGSEPAFPKGHRVREDGTMSSQLQSVVLAGECRVCQGEGRSTIGMLDPLSANG